MAYENGLNLKATELRLGLPGADEKDSQSSPGSPRNHKRPSPELTQKRNPDNEIAPPSKAQIVGWPPVQSFRRNSFPAKKAPAQAESLAGSYVKVSMDGAAYLRKIDLSLYKGYPELLKGLEGMFQFSIGEYYEREGYKGSEYAPTYEDKDGDWMLVGDVPWNMFISSCKRLRIMKGSEAKGLGCVA